MLPYNTSLFLASSIYFHISLILSDKNHTKQLACYGGSLKVIDFMLRHGKCVSKVLRSLSGELSWVGNFSSGDWVQRESYSQFEVASSADKPPP